MRRRVLGLASVAGLLALAVLPAAGGSVAADSSAPSVAVSATSQITDGQTVTITVRSIDAVPTYQAIARLCRGGVTYQSSTQDRPNPDFESNGPNCPGPANPISTSSDATVTDRNTFGNASGPDGETFQYRLGAGVQNWHDSVHGGAPTSVTCDETHVCNLVVEVQYSPADKQPAQWKPFVFPLSYGVTDPIAGCGGPAKGVLDTGGSDRMQDAWVALTLGTCAVHPDVHAPGRASFLGEGSGVEAFGAGTLDLAYTAGGFDADMARGSTAASGLILGSTPHRPAVAIPIALNAAVLGIGGGVPTDGTHKVPYKDIKMTATDFAAMISGGATLVGHDPYHKDILDRNPQLFQTDLFDPSAGLQVGAYSDPEASSWYATRYLEQVAPDAWKVPSFQTYGSDQGRPRGRDAGLARADPSYVLAIKLESGRPALAKDMLGPGPATGGGIWVLTDLQTANALALSPVQVEDAKGHFVAPTAAALAAALPSMKADDQGILISDPTNTAAQGGVQPYPMTFVEYALAPAEPLVNDDCSLRTDSQQLLTNWLTYITGDGQAKLPPGLIPLPTDLKAQSAAAVQKVGASPVTGKCVATAQPPTIAPPAVDQPVAAPAATSVSEPIASSPSASSPPLAADFTQPPTLASGPLASDASGSSSGSGASDAAAPVNRIASIPAFVRGGHGSGWSGAVLALIGIITLSSLALLATARQR